MPCDTSGVSELRCYCFRFWGLFWLGWVMRRRNRPEPLYYDDTPYVIMYPEVDICYATIGLTRGGVMGRLQKYVGEVKEKENE